MCGGLSRIGFQQGTIYSREVISMINKNCYAHLVMEVETCSHILFACPKVEVIWKNCYAWLEVQTVLPRNMEEQMWQQVAYIKCKEEIFRWYVVWCIWKRRNALLFKRIEFDVKVVICGVFCMVMDAKQYQGLQLLFCSMVIGPFDMYI